MQPLGAAASTHITHRWASGEEDNTLYNKAVLLDNHTFPTFVEAVWNVASSSLPVPQWCCCLSLVNRSLELHSWSPYPLLLRQEVCSSALSLCNQVPRSPSSDAETIPGSNGVLLEVYSQICHLSTPSHRLKEGSAQCSVMDGGRWSGR